MNEEELRDRFSSYDPEDTGLIDLDSFRRILHEYAQEYNIILKIQDVHLSSKVHISFDEFKTYMLRNASEDSPVNYHPDGSINWISSFQFNAADTDTPSPPSALSEGDLSEEAVIEILHRLDSNEDGQLSFAEFLRHHKPSKDAFRTIDLKI